MTTLERVSLLAARLMDVCGVPLDRALECARNSIAAEGECESLAVAVEMAVAHRVRIYPDVWGAAWAARAPRSHLEHWARYVGSVCGRGQ